MAEHTPGPWRTKVEHYRWADNYARLVFGPDANDGTPVAAACDFNRTDRDAEVDANARLIAAAPDLLAALYAAQAAFAPETIDEPTFDPHGAVGPDEAVGLMLAAIAKARGEAPHAK